MVPRSSHQRFRIPAPELLCSQTPGALPQSEASSAASISRGAHETIQTPTDAMTANRLAMETDKPARAI
jgi:hypothetical protein